MDFKAYLKTMVEKDASDLYLSSGAPASAKFDGTLQPLEDTKLSTEQVREIAYAIMDSEQIAEFEHKPEMNLAISEEGIGRFRVNIFRQRNSISLVIRNIKTDIPNWELLGLPSILTDVIMEKRGLVLFVGATGSGKSTSLASLIDYRNTNTAGHIITIEDPVEFVHSHKKSQVSRYLVKDFGTSKSPKSTRKRDAYCAPAALRPCHFATPSQARRWLRSTPSNG